MSAASSCLQRNTTQLKAFAYNRSTGTTSNEPCRKAGKSERVINEVVLDSTIIKAFYSMIILFTKQSFACT